MRTTAISTARVLVIALGLVALFILLWEPHLEGRNAQATLFEMYFKDPFLAYAYVAAIPFFIGLYQGFKALSYLHVRKITETAHALRLIRICALIVAAFIAGGEIYLFTVVRGNDDIAGGVAVGLFLLAASIIVALTAKRLEKRSQKAAR